MVLMAESAKRGGLCQTAHRYGRSSAHANKKDGLLDDFLSKIAGDDNNENVEILERLIVEEESIKAGGMETHIAYLDINSMYADCMT